MADNTEPAENPENEKPMISNLEIKRKYLLVKHLTLPGNPSFSDFIPVNHLNLKCAGKFSLTCPVGLFLFVSMVGTREDMKVLS